MAWSLYWKEFQNEEQMSIPYERISPPNSSVSETWKNVGITHYDAQIMFHEYSFYDNDPDGVREAYGQMYDSEYTFTVDTSQAKEDLLFAYTLYTDGRVIQGFDIDMDTARAVYVFTKPQNITDEMLQTATEHIEQAPRYAGAVEEIIGKELIEGREDVMYLATFKNR